jgi:hypothetical protein
VLRGRAHFSISIPGTVMNKAEKANRNRLMIAGVQKHYGANDTILVDGVPTKQTDIVARLQAPVAAADSTATSEAAFHKAVADEKAANATADATFQGLKSYFLSIYATSTETLADYGLSAVVKKEPSAATKAAAVAKREATRAARGTGAKNQPAAVTAPAPAATPPASTPTTPKPQ